MLVTSPRDVLDVLERSHLYAPDCGDEIQAQRQVVSEETAHRTATDDKAGTTPGTVTLVDVNHRQPVMELLGPDPVDVDVVVRESRLPSRLVHMVRGLFQVKRHRAKPPVRARTLGNDNWETCLKRCRLGRWISQNSLKLANLN